LATLLDAGDDRRVPCLASHYAVIQEAFELAFGIKGVVPCSVRNREAILDLLYLVRAYPLQAQQADAVCDILAGGQLWHQPVDGLLRAGRRKCVRDGHLECWPER